MNLPVVAIVGRPNVGKSSLFNRLVRNRVAIVTDEPGTTRDRIAVEVTEGDTRFLLVDTGGLEFDPETDMRLGIRAQVDAALNAADAIIFLCDIMEGVIVGDQEIAQILRESTKPVLIAVNKVDNNEREYQAAEFYKLGMDEPLLLSAHHGRGVAELIEWIVDTIPSLPPDDEESLIRVSIIGRPNVGKSALLNAILGEERVVVSDIPGTTRDAIDTQIEYEENTLLLIDTAGIRRRGSIERGVEKFSVLRSLSAINRADIAILVIDATEPLPAQDLHIAGYAQDGIKGLIVVVNKWDLVNHEKTNAVDISQFLRSRIKFFTGFPIVFTSALEKEGIDLVLEAILKIHAERQIRVSTSQLNRVLARAAAEHLPPLVKGRRLSVYYGTQADINPPTFVLFVNDPSRMHFSYRRFLENTLRREFGFDGTGIQIKLRARSQDET